jgi:cytidylate kinase|tara:strand:- start:3 stop:536 length:534 start_codon:yes stop_codon:yes gene_type:complete
MSSVGKTTVALDVSKKYKLKHFSGGDILKELAINKDESVSGSDWWDKKHGMRFLSQRIQNPKFDKLVDKKLSQLISKGNVVVTSYPIPWLTTKGINVWLGGSFQSRAKRLSNRDNISLISAKKILDKRDKNNYRIYKKLYKINFGKDLSVFDFVINTDDLNSKQVSDILYCIVKQFQ